MTATLTRAPLRSEIRAPHRLAPAIVGFFGFVLSFIGSWNPSVWFDEAATITSATRSWAELWAEIQNIDAVHAAYYSLMHATFSVFGYSPLTLRLPSAIAVGATAALLVVLVRKIADSRLAVTAGVLFCLIPRVTWMGGEGRSYAISALLAVVITLALLHAVRSRRRMPWVFYCASVVVGVLFFSYLVFVVAALAVTMIILAFRRGPDAAALTRRWLAATAAAAIVVLPFLLLVQSQQNQVKWLSPIDGEIFRDVFVRQWFLSPEVPFLLLLGWSLLIFGVVAIIRHRELSALRALIFPLVALPTVGLIVISVAYAPLYTPRYLSMCTPFVAIVMAAGIARLKRPIAVIAVLAVVAATAVPNLVITQRSSESKQQSSWSKVASILEQNRAADGYGVGVIYGPLEHHPATSSEVMQLAYPGAFRGTSDVTLDETGASRATLWDSRLPLPASLERMRGMTVAYLITSTGNNVAPATTRVLAAEGWRVSDDWSLTNVELVRYERSGSGL